MATSYYKVVAMAKRNTAFTSGVVQQTHMKQILYFKRYAEKCFAANKQHTQIDVILGNKYPAV